MDLFHGSAESEIIAYQGRVSNALNFKDAREWVMDCNQWGVPPYILEALLCNALARYVLLPRRIEIFYTARRDDKLALRYIEWIDSVLAGMSRRAGQTGALFKIEDPTGALVDEGREKLSFVADIFEDAPAREKELRARLGLPGERLRPPKEAAGLSASLRRKEAEQQAAKHKAVGFFSAEMTVRFSDHKPRDELIASLLRAVGVFVDQDEVRSCRYAYLRDVR